MAGVCFSVSLGCAGSQPRYDVTAVKLFSILFDQETYPGELENLAAKYPEKVSDLNSLMETWIKYIVTKPLTSNPAYDASRPLFIPCDEAIKNEQAQKKVNK